MHCVVLKDGACASGTRETRTSPSQGGSGTRGFVIEHFGSKCCDGSHARTVQVVCNTHALDSDRAWKLRVFHQCTVICRRLSCAHGVSAESSGSNHCGAGALRKHSFTADSTAGAARPQCRRRAQVPRQGDPLLRLAGLRACVLLYYELRVAIRALYNQSSMR